jgi:hypothetical protein
MHAVVTTWRIRDVPDSSRDAFITEFVQRGITAARALNVLDVLLVALEPDQLISISLFDSLDDALVTRPVALAFVDDHYSRHLDLISRVTGLVYELSDLADLDVAAMRQGRQRPDGSLSVQLATWRLGPDVRAPDQLLAFLRELIQYGLPTVLEDGLLDVFGIRTADDTLLIVRLIERPDALDTVYAPSAWQDLSALIAHRVELVEQVVGNAFDMPTLLHERSGSSDLQ